MTTTDNSPSLGGQADDLSPMISSAATRAIANPEGALHLERLKPLLLGMSLATEVKFQQAVVGQGLFYASNVWPLLAAEPSYVELLDAARVWVTDPSDESHSEVLRLFIRYRREKFTYTQAMWRRVGANVPPEALEAIVYNTIQSIRPRLYPGDMRHALNTIHTARFVAAILSSGTRASINREVKQARAWQIEAARAILDDAPIPPLEPAP